MFRRQFRRQFQNIWSVLDCKCQFCSRTEFSWSRGTCNDSGCRCAIAWSGPSAVGAVGAVGSGRWSIPFSQLAFVNICQYLQLDAACDLDPPDRRIVGQDWQPQCWQSSISWTWHLLRRTDIFKHFVLTFWSLFDPTENDGKWACQRVHHYRHKAEIPVPSNGSFHCRLCECTRWSLHQRLKLRAHQNRTT